MPPSGNASFHESSGRLTWIAHPAPRNEAPVHVTLGNKAPVHVTLGRDAPLAFAAQNAGYLGALVAVPDAVVADIGHATCAARFDRVATGRLATDDAAAEARPTIVVVLVLLPWLETCETQWPDEKGGPRLSMALAHSVIVDQIELSKTIVRMKAHAWRGKVVCVVDTHENTNRF